MHNTRAMSRVILAMAVASLMAACGGADEDSATGARTAEQRAALEVAAKINSERMKRATTGQQ